MGPSKHGSSVTIFDLSTSAQIGDKINVWRGCVSASQAEVDYFGIVTEFPCLLGHTVYPAQPIQEIEEYTISVEIYDLNSLPLLTSIASINVIFFNVFFTLNLYRASYLNIPICCLYYIILRIDKKKKKKKLLFT